MKKRPSCCVWDGSEASKAAVSDQWLTCNLAIRLQDHWNVPLFLCLLTAAVYFLFAFQEGSNSIPISIYSCQTMSPLKLILSNSQRSQYRNRYREKRESFHLIYEAGLFCIRRKPATEALICCINRQQRLYSMHKLHANEGIYCLCGKEKHHNASTSVGYNNMAKACEKECMHAPIQLEHILNCLKKPKTNPPTFNLKWITNMNHMINVTWCSFFSNYLNCILASSRWRTKFVFTCISFMYITLHWQSMIYQK